MIRYLIPIGLAALFFATQASAKEKSVVSSDVRSSAIGMREGLTRNASFRSQKLKTTVVKGKNQQPTPEESKAFIDIDLRPSVLAEDSKIYFDNHVEAGYQFSKLFTLSYRQLFIFEAGNLAAKESGGALADGFIRAQFSEVGYDKSWDLSAGLESRVYLPTDATKREHSFYGAWRNYLKLEKKFGQGFSLIFWEVPILHGYSATGFTSKDKEVANPFFENRVYFGPVFFFFNKKLTFVFPVILSNTRYHDHAEGAAYNNDWNHILWLNPEVTYQITPNLRLGVGYETANFLSDSSTQGAQGFAGGIGQAIIGLTF